jgi:hypothetical protein
VGFNAQEPAFTGEALRRGDSFRQAIYKFILQKKFYKTLHAIVFNKCFTHITGGQSSGSAGTRFITFLKSPHTNLVIELFKNFGF